MCGLAAFFGEQERTCPRAVVAKMLEAQKHRGPDRTDTWSSQFRKTGVALGLSRLKILDLTDAASQPMISEDGRYVLAYNGEVYNYLELREHLTSTGSRFRTTGDTEVVLQALIKWGPDALSRFNGMWALVLVDVVSGQVLLARDRFGIKPLYTWSDAAGFYIASEIKAILVGTGRRFRVNPEVASAFLRQNLLCTGPSTFFTGIDEFPAGSYVVTQIDTLRDQRLAPRRFWSMPTTSTYRASTEDELVDHVRSTFIDSVNLRLRSDVPVGVLLSGGMDSSAIAAALHYLRPNGSGIRLISAVGSPGKDESAFVDRMAAHLNREVDKVSLNYLPSQSFDLVGEASWFNDEPIGSFSTIGHFLLMKRAKELGVTVLLSGQGADELLCGYQKYLAFYLQELLRSGRWREAVHVLHSFLERGTVVRQWRYREAKRYLPRWLRLKEIDVSGSALRHVAEGIDVGLTGASVIQRQILDVEHLSVPAFVHYEDRMSMAMAREIRLPFLDWRVVSLLLPLAVEYKLRNGWTKWIFRRAMEPLLPPEIVWRRDKQHFIVPQNDWLRRELRDAMMQLLKEDWVSEQLGLVNLNNVRLRYDAYVRQTNGDGRLNFKDVFAPLSLELWARRFEAHLTT